MRIESSGQTPYGAIVNEDGRLLTKSSSVLEQTTASLEGNTFNINTGTITLTSDVETPVIYLKNTSETSPLIISKVFFNLASSAGGTGETSAAIYADITGGTVITGANLPIYNFNFGSGKEIGVVSKIGGTGITFLGGRKPFDFLLPTLSTGYTVPLDSIVLPRGSSLTVTIKPPTGNTSIKLQAGFNLYLSSDED